MTQLCVVPQPGAAPSVPARPAPRSADQATGAAPTFEEVLGQHTVDGTSPVVPQPLLLEDIAASPAGDAPATTPPSAQISQPADPPDQQAVAPAAVPVATATLPVAQGAPSTDLDGVAPVSSPTMPTGGVYSSRTSPGQVTAQPSVAGAGDAPAWASVTGSSESGPRAAGAPIAPLSPGTSAPPAVPATEPVAVPAGPIAATPTASAAVPVPEQASPPAATAPSLPAQLVPRLTSVKSLGDGVHRLTLRVEPESIGAVRVVAEVRGEVVRLELVGGTEAAREALRAVLPELKRDLAATGMQAQLELGDPGNGQPGDQSPRATRQRDGAGPEPGHPETDRNPAPDRTDAVPANGRVDVLA